MNDAKYQAKEVLCPLCGDKTDRQEFDFFKCPGCGCEVWPDDREETEEEVTKAIRQAYHEELRVGYQGVRKKGGGRSGRRRKKQVKPVPITERNILY